MISVTLPDGRVIEVDVPDAQSAASAAHKFFLNQPMTSAPTQMTVTPDVPGIEPQFSPTPEPTGATRTAMIGAQGVGRGLAELVGTAQEPPIRAVNAVTAGLNRFAGTEIPPLPMPSDVYRESASKLVDAIGPGTVNPDNMSFPEKVGYQVGRFGAQTAATAPALVRAAATRAPELAAGALPRTGDSFLRPYMGESVVRPLVGDAAASAGAGTATAAADETQYKDNPVVEAMAALAGAYGGMTIPQTAERIGRAAFSAAGRPFGYHLDKTIPADPQTLAPVPKAVSDRAAAMVQDEAVNPADAATRMVNNRDQIRTMDPNAPMPMATALSEDAGLSSLEKVIRDREQGTAIAKDQKFNSGVRDSVDRSVPAGADVSALVRRVQAEADARTAAVRDAGNAEVAAAQNAADNSFVSAAEAGRKNIAQTRDQNTQDVGQARRLLETAVRRQGRVEEIRQGDAADVTPYAGRGVPASQRLDQNIVDQGYIPARTEKNRQFDTAPGREDQIPADDVFAAIDRVRANNNRLRPDAQLPGDLVARLDRLRPVIDETGTNVGGPGTARGADLADTRKFISTAYEQAQRAGNFDLADSLATLRASINRTIETAPGYAEANANYRGFAGTYRPSPNEPAAQFTRALDRDPGRGKTPPSETAGRFIQPQAPEKHAALQRMIDGAADPAAGRAAAREYLLSDLEASGAVRDGVLNPARLQAWQRKWGDLETVVPGMGAEIAQLTDRATRGQRVAVTVAERAAAAERNLTQTQASTERDLHQAQMEADRSTRQVKMEGGRSVRETQSAADQRLARTQQEIDSGTFGSVLKADTDKAVAAAMNHPTQSGRMLGELIATTGTDPAARDGLKAAVRDYLVNKATNNAPQNMAPGDRRGAVSYDKLTKVFNEHENELARIFSPGEMNTLRAGHQALELAMRSKQTRAGVGSNTVEKASLIDKMLGTPVGKGIEAALRVKYGMLKAGGLLSTARRLTAGVTGGPSDSDVLRLVERAAYDPELMGQLLGRKLPVGSPAWNSKMQKLLAVSGGIENAEGN